MKFWLDDKKYQSCNNADNKLRTYGVKTPYMTIKEMLNSLKNIKKFTEIVNLIKNEFINFEDYKNFKRAESSNFIAEKIAHKTYRILGKNSNYIKTVYSYNEALEYLYQNEIVSSNDSINSLEKLLLFVREWNSKFIKMINFL